uniref:Uncharacterized protein n=1 Tax=Anguilla anguilla TaxID=7936 RepID=A0A0E9PFZ1_ANGAN
MWREKHCLSLTVDSC